MVAFSPLRLTYSSIKVDIYDLSSSKTHAQVRLVAILMMLGSYLLVALLAEINWWPVGIFLER